MSTASLNWMRSNRFQLSVDKTELIWCRSIRKLLHLPSCSFSVAGSLICPVNTVHDLGVFINNDLGMVTHVRRGMSCCFAAVHQLFHLRRYVANDCFCSLVVSLGPSRLDYGNFCLVGLPAYLQKCLHFVLNTTACLLLRLGCYDHVS